MAVFITLEQHSAWEKRFESLPTPGTYPQLPRDCGEAFFVQALSGLPLLQGVPPSWARCDPNAEFHWGHELIWRELQVTNLDDAAICAIARKRAVQTVLVLRSTEDRTLNNVLECKKND
jgi:hypothetical protein